MSMWPSLLNLFVPRKIKLHYEHELTFSRNKEEADHNIGVNLERLQALCSRARAGMVLDVFDKQKGWVDGELIEHPVYLQIGVRIRLLKKDASLLGMGDLEKELGARLQSLHQLITVEQFQAYCMTLAGLAESYQRAL